MSGGAPPEPQTFEEYKARIEELDVSTEPNTAVFYSRKDPVFGDEVFDRAGQGVTEDEVAESAHGGHRHPGHDDRPIKSRDIAESYATQTGRTTLEMTKGGGWLDDQDLYHKFDASQAEELWGRLAERYAEGASGEVVAFSRAGANDRTAVWLRELDALKSNRAVTKIENYGLTPETLVKLDYRSGPGGPGSSSNYQTNENLEAVMDEKPVEIRFDPSDREHIPAEVREAIPPDKLDSFLNGMEGEAVYRRGPAPSDMNLVRYHDSNLPTTPDRPTWHTPLEDAGDYTLIASDRNIHQAVTEANAAGIPVPPEAAAYAAGPEDVVEPLALPGTWGPRDAETHLHIPQGAYVVTIESLVAKQPGGPDPKRGYPGNMPASDRDDYRAKGDEYPGQGRQVLVVTYDADNCKVTPRMKSVDLKNDAQVRQAAAFERMRKSAQNDDSEGWDRAKTEYEKAAADEQKLRQSTDSERPGYSMS
jgi:hypothetical protein